MNKSDPHQILEQALRLPPSSQSIIRLMKVMGDEKHRFQEVIRIVELDGALTAEVLRLVNSAAFSLRQSVTTVQRAIPYLGEQMVISIALRSCMPYRLSKSAPGYRAAADELWSHSLKTAIARSAWAVSRILHTRAGDTGWRAWCPVPRPSRQA